MSEEDITIQTGAPGSLETADFEQVLERLVVIAGAQGRGFLAYLLTMALIHLRDGDPGRTTAAH